MRRVINILVSVIFLISFIGINIHKHYSDGKLYSTAVFHKAEKCCADVNSCDITKKNNRHKHHQKDGCSCEDKTETIMISDVFVIERFYMPVVKILDIHFVLQYQPRNTEFFNSVFESDHINKSPPDLYKTDFQSESGVFLC